MLTTLWATRQAIHKEKSNKTQQCIKTFIIPYLYEAQHVSGDTPPIIRSLNLHWHPPVFHKWKVVGFERKVLRKIYGPTKEMDSTWRIKSNEELNRLTGIKNIINYIKAQRLVWFGHVHHMPDNSMVKKSI
jgi:hypothetical protein